MSRHACRHLTGLAVVSMLLGGCATPRSYVALLKNRDGTTGQLTVRGPAGATTLTRSGDGAALDGSTRRPFRVAPGTIQKDFAAALAAEPMPPRSFLLYFEKAGTELTVESRAMLATIAQEVKARPSADLSIVGHTDTLADAASNEELALQRARAVARMLQLDAPNITEVTITSHGERDLLIVTPDGVEEPRNRRVQVTVR